MWGMKRTSHGEAPNHSIQFAYYGDIFERDQPIATERSVGNTHATVDLEAELAVDLEQSFSSQKREQRTGTSDLVRIVAALEDRFRMGGAIIRRFLKDVDLYLTDQSTRERTISRLIDELSIDNEPCLVIAHSLGSIVSYDALTSYSELETAGLITLGSPLGLKAIVNSLGSRSDLRFPPNLAFWTNVFNKEDFVCAQPYLSDVYSSNTGRSITDVETMGRPTGLFSLGAAHDFSTYLASPVTGFIIHSFLQDLAN